MSIPGLERRRFLRETRNLAAMTSLVTLGGACSQDVPPVPDDVDALSAEQAHTLARLIETITPAVGAFPAGADLGLLRAVDTTLAQLDSHLRARLLDALLFLEWAPQFSLRFKPFSQLGTDERRAVLDDFAASALQTKRTIYAALKGLIVFVYADHPEVWPHMGYDGPWVGRPVP